jgi:hypothetical protein
MFTHHSLAISALLASLLIALVPDALGETVAAEKCTTDPPTPEAPAVVTGFAGERLYIFSKHPSLCANADSPACKPKGYVLPGDPIIVSEACGNWSFMSFRGKKSQTTGWIAPRFTKGADPGASPALPSSDHSLIPACEDTASRMNAWLNRPNATDHMLPSALSNSVSIDKLPTASGATAAGPNVWQITVSDAQVAGIAIKALSYDAGGTCHSQSLELWDSKFQKQIIIPTSSIDESTNGPSDPGDDTGYSSEDLVKLQGDAYFAHITRSASIIKLYRLSHDMTAAPVCEIERLPANKESLVFSADGALCDAVMSGRIEDAGLIETEPSTLSEEVSSRLLRGYSLGGIEVIKVALGRADPYNDGSNHLVAMLSFAYSDGAGCGHGRGYQWPVILNGEGAPTHTVDGDAAFENAGNVSRLIAFRGVTYFETRLTDASDDLPTHEVWKLSTGRAVMVCAFNPSRYRSVPVPVPASK